MARFRSGYSGFTDLGCRPTGKDIVCSFYVKPSKGISIRGAAERIAGESSVGTWTEVGTMNKGIHEKAARVFEIKGNWVKVAYPGVLFEPGNMPQIMSSIAGNIFGMKDVEKLRLHDVKWPKHIVKSFRGPRFGVQGIRKMLTVPKRPLVGTIIKPKLGLSHREHAKVAYEAWAGGCDIVKDDENLSNQSFNRFNDRIRLTLKMRDKAEKETGEKKIYMPNVTAETNEMLKRARFVKAQGGRYIMVDILTCGWSGLQTLRDADLGMVMHAHRAGHAAFTRGMHGISMLVVADIARLIGVDQLHVGTVVGKMEGGKEEVMDLVEEMEKDFIPDKPGRHKLSERWHGVKPVFAVCSGGLHPGHVPKLVRMLGKDIIIQMGGGIHGHPDGTRAGATAARQAVDAVLRGQKLKAYAKRHSELAKAIRTWGI